MRVLPMSEPVRPGCEPGTGESALVRTRPLPLGYVREFQS